MVTVSIAIAVPASPEHAWAIAADLSRLSEWLVLHEAWRGEVPSALAPGVELTSVVRVMGLRNRIAWRIDAYDPPRLLSITGRGAGGVRVTLVMSVALDGGTTVVAVRAEISGAPTRGPIGLIIGRAVRGDLRRSAAALTALLG
jgi:uncharacterized protein YndB with AHSA1/START domain